MNPLFDMLSRALTGDTASNPEPHFDNVAKQAPPDLVGDGVAEAFKSDKTEPFPQMVESLFSRSNSTQQAGLLNQFLQAAGPAVLGAAGGALSRMLQPGHNQVTAVQASSLRPEQVRDIAAAAQQHAPSVLDQVGRFYGDHPTLIKTIGGAALTIVLAQMKRKMENR